MQFVLVLERLSRQCVSMFSSPFSLKPSAISFYLLMKATANWQEFERKLWTQQCENIEICVSWYSSLIVLGLE